MLAAETIYRQLKEGSSMGVDETSLDRIRNATFPAARRGYDKHEVEKFLARLADWLETGAGDESRSDVVKRELEKVGERTGAILAQAAGAEVVGEHPLPADGGEPTVTVRGRDGRAYDGSPLGNSVAWEEEPGLRISLYSHALTRDQLLAIAQENGDAAQLLQAQPGDCFFQR